MGGFYIPPKPFNGPPIAVFIPTLPAPPSANNLGGTPGLVTSTGGLYGAAPLLLTPTFDTLNKRNGLYVTDATNFDTEMDCVYFFPSPNIATCAGKPVTVNHVVLEYRELGIATFFIGIVIYGENGDVFKFVEKEVRIRNISPKTNRFNLAFPDMQIHTKKVALVIDGERPQLYIKRLANSGPMSIISATLIGVADVKEVL